jgi:hypothetical protein
MEPSSESSSTEPDNKKPLRLAATATHEAAHAVAAVVLGLELRSVDIRKEKMPGGVRLGGAIVGIDDFVGKGKDAAMPYLVLSIVGSMAEADINPDCFDEFTNGYDIKYASAIAAAALYKGPLHSDVVRVDAQELERIRPHVNELLDSATEAAEEFVNEHYLVIAQVAELLLKREELTGDEVRAIVTAA